MTKLTFGLLLVSFVGALPQVPKGPGPIENWPVIQYDGPRYEMTPEMFQERLNNKSWERPADMPIIPVEPGRYWISAITTAQTAPSTRDPEHAKLRPFRAPAVLILLKLRRSRILDAGPAALLCTQVQLGRAAMLDSSTTGIPTHHDVWETWGCSGQRLAHFGVIDTGSCTTLPSNKVFRSFIGYWNC